MSVLCEPFFMNLITVFSCRREEGGTVNQAPQPAADPMLKAIAHRFCACPEPDEARIPFMSILRESDNELSAATSAILTPETALLPMKTATLEESWFALYVQVNHEREVTKRLEQRDINAFLPLIECWSKRRDRRKKVSLPLFPGYLFVRTVLDNTTHVHILKTPGALTLIGNSEGPLAIPPYQIQSLQTMLRSPEPIQLNPYLKKGDWVHVIRGPLAGCMGILLRQNPKKGRLIVSVDIICRSVCVELDMEDVEPIAAPA
jgi:transcription termination/antitermination protein NusG